MSTGVKVVGAIGEPTGRHRRRHHDGDVDEAQDLKDVERRPSRPERPSAARQVSVTDDVADDVHDEPLDDRAEPADTTAPARPAERRRTRSAVARRRRLALGALSVVAAGGIVGTVAFGTAWSNLSNQGRGAAQAEQSGRVFLNALTNFSAKTVDSDFAAITSMATGPFASQAQKFFNSAIRQELMTAQAESQGQIRSLYVETYGGGQASVYGVVDQVYANDKSPTPQSDVLRVVVNLALVQGAWNISDVTVLEGPTLGGSSAGSSTGSGGATGSTTTPSATGTTTGG